MNPKTYEIPTANGVKTVTANSKQEALSQVTQGGNTPTLKTAPPVNTTITADSLTPSNPINIPNPVNTNTARTNLNNTLATLTPTANEIAQDNALQLKQQPTEQQLNVNRLKEIAGIQAGQGADVQAYSQKVGTDTAAKALNESNKALLRLDESYKAQIDRINANKEGKFGGAVAQDLKDAETSYLDTKYKLNIDKLVAQGDVDTAKGLVDQYIAFKYEPLQNELKTRQLLANAISNDLTESEKVAINAKIQSDKDALDFQRQKDLLDYKANLDAIANANKTGATDLLKENKDLATINDINSILNSKSFGSVFGLTNIVNRNIPGTDAYAVAAQVDNVMQQLALAARGQLKGQGQVSDFEGKMLRDAQTALKLNMSPAQAKKELTKVKGAIATSMGLSVPIAIKDSRSGVTKYGMGTQSIINDAIAQGYSVEYR